MTKEEMIKRVELAYGIYEQVKHIPVNEREAIFSMVHQLSNKDWTEYYNSQKMPFVGCVQTEAGPVNGI